MPKHTNGARGGSTRRSDVTSDEMKDQGTQPLYQLPPMEPYNASQLSRSSSNPHSPPIGIWLSELMGRRRGGQGGRNPNIE